MPSATSDSSILLEHYLAHVPGLRPVPGRAGVFDAADVRRGARLVIGSHASLGRLKTTTLFGRDSAWLQLGARGSWDAHHVVEGQHFAAISFQGDDFPRMYARALPCVLLDSFEHQQYYNEVLHSAETAELLALGPAPTREARAREAYRAFRRARQARDAAALASLRERVDRLGRLYADTYADAPLLRRIAANVIAHARSLLDA